MSNNNQQRKLNKKNQNNHSNNMNSISSKQSDNKQYNVIINQNSTFNQDNSINIMLDGSFPYFQNYNYQPNETEANKNQIYPLYLEKQPNSKKQETKEESKEKIGTPKHRNKKRRQYSPKNRQKKEKEEQNQNSTNKIDYRYVKKRPIKEMITPYKTEINKIDKDNQLFWFATYDKLMKTKYLLKIFNYYNNRPFESQHNLNYNFKEKTLVIKDFEIYFYENSNKPFIRYNKGSTIYTKLYLLTLKQINQIFSYLNRIEYKINYDRLNYLQRKGTFELINDNTNEVVLPYCLIYCLGKYMNINIYAFSNNIDFNIYLDENSFQKSQRISSYTVLDNENNNNIRRNCLLSNDKRNNKMDNTNTNINRDNFKLPNSKKIAKLIKIINLNFPDFSIDELINYLIPDNKYLNAITKINEIKNIFFFKKSANNKFYLSSMVRDTIKGISIQTPKSLISSFCPAESIIENNSYKNSDLFLPPNKKYVIPIKDDYKFQTISTNEKDNNKNNPFIIYVCDNVQKINFTNDNNQINPMNNNNNLINNNINNNNIYPQNNNNKSIEINTNYIDTNNNNNFNINNNATNTNNTNKQKTNKKIIERKNNNKKPNEKIKIKPIKLHNEINTNTNTNNKSNNNNNITLSGTKKGIKIKRISTDINTLKYKAKYKSLSGVANLKNKPRESYSILRSNMPLGNLNNTVKQLNKSIEGKNLGHYLISKNSDKKKKQKKNSNVNNINNKNKLISRVNLNKKDNPFFNEDNTNNNNNFNSNI